MLNARHCRQGTPLATPRIRRHTTDAMRGSHPLIAFRSVVGRDDQRRGASCVECIEAIAERIKIGGVDIPSPPLPCAVGRQRAQEFACGAGVGVQFGGEFLRCHLISLSSGGISPSLMR